MPVNVPETKLGMRFCAIGVSGATVGISAANLTSVKGYCEPKGMKEPGEVEQPYTDRKQGCVFTFSLSLCGETLRNH